MVSFDESMKNREHVLISVIKKEDQKTIKQGMKELMN